METNVNYTVVGAFIVVLISLAVLAIIWLSSGFSFVQYSTYAVYMQEAISGLNIDSPVEFNGVDVGNVSSIQIDLKNPQIVQLLLKVKSSTPITRGSVAMLNTRGITGVTYVSLKDKGDDLQPLKATKGEQYPVIKTAPSLFLRLDTTLSQLSSNLHEVSKSIQSVLDKENQQAIKGTLSNLQKITENLAANNMKLNQILENTARASKQFAPLIQSSAGTIKTFESQTLPMAYHLLFNLNQMTQNLNEVSIQIKQNPSVLIRGPAQPQLGPGERR